MVVSIVAKLNCELQLLSRHTMLGNLRQKDGRDLASRHLLNHLSQQESSEVFGSESPICKATGKASPILCQRETKLQPCYVLALVPLQGWLPPMTARFHQECCLKASLLVKAQQVRTWYVTCCSCYLIFSY